MKEVINKTKYTCDKCGEQITDTVFFLRCYAETVTGEINTESAMQNIKENFKTMFGDEKHLCKKCKDVLTDGIFIV